MAKIGWYGTGRMGAAFVQRLLARGDEVVAYNRSAHKARALEPFGARATNDPRETARGASRLHLMLADDAAVDGLLEILEGALDENAVVIDHSTVAPHLTADRFARMAAKGIPFLHAPVFMSPAAAREGTGVMLVAGSEELFGKVRPELEQMTGHLWYLGEKPEKASAMKLFGNEMLVVLSAGLADMYGLAKSVGITAPEAYELFAHFKPVGALEARGKKMSEGDFTPSFELTMARKDVRLMLETAGQGNVTLNVLPAIAQRMDALIAAGYGAEDLAVLGIDAVRAKSRA